VKNWVDICVGELLRDQQECHEPVPPREAVL
jgi:hypothetical protein